MDYTEVLRKKNKILSVILLISVILRSVVNTFFIDVIAVIPLAIAGFVVAAILYFMAKKVKPALMMYLNVIFLTGISIACMLFIPCTTNYLMFFQAIFMIILYEEFKPVLLQCIASGICMTVFYFQYRDMLAASWNPDAWAMCLVYIVSALLVFKSLCSITRQQFDHLEKINLESETLLDEIKKSVCGLENTSGKINNSITVTEEIARKYGNVVDDHTFYTEERKYRRKPKVFNRGLQSILMTKDYSYQNKENKAALNAIFAALNDGTLSPGDDIEEFLKSKGLRIKSIGLFKRLLIAAGIEGIEPGELEYDPMIALEANELDELLPEHDDEMYVLVVESNTIPDIPNINTPKELSDWMKRNIKYKEFDKLMSYDDVLSTGKGSCHDQALFEKKVFDKYLDLKTGLLFFVEYNESESAGGMTHTLLYYIENGKYYWFENAWGGEDGIHGPYGSIKELKNAVTAKHNKMPSSKRYRNLEWGTVPVSKLKPGISLGEYVDICLG